MIKKYKKKPEIVEAVQFTGANLDELKAFVPMLNTEPRFMVLSTFTGQHFINVGDYIVKNTDGEYQVHSERIFLAMYALV